MEVKIEIRGAQSFSVEFEKEDGFDVLSAQAQSICGAEQDLILVEGSGRCLIDDELSFSTLDKDGIVYGIDQKALSACSAFLGEEVIQPSFRIEGTHFVLCKNCTSKIDASLVSSGDHLEAFSCDCKQAADFGLLYTGSGSETKQQEEGREGEGESREYSTARDLYVKRELLHAALQQEERREMPHYQHLSVQSFKKRLEHGISTVMVYEQEEQLKAARGAIDYARIKKKADEYSSGSPCAPDVAMIVGLLRWFKDDFFRWCGKPKCEHADCQAPPQQMVSARTEQPSPEERNVGWASRTEVYKCKECSRETRFARFNNPAHLLTTRRGRCGEWANCFCLVCRALSLDARYVLDFTDHVWVEVFVPSMGRFVHCDPCEKSFDAPLCYEQGWNKALTHVLSFSRYGVADSSARYSRMLQKVILRRGHALQEGCVLESAAKRAIAEADARVEASFVQHQQQGYLRGGQTASGFSRLRGTFASSTLSMLADPVRLAGSNPSAVFASTSVLELTVEDMQKRKALDRWEIGGLSFQRKAVGDPGKAEESQGRSSGDAEWKAQRGEDGGEGDKEKNRKNEGGRDDGTEGNWKTRAARQAAKLHSSRTSYIPSLTQTGCQPWLDSVPPMETSTQRGLLLALCLAQDGVLDAARAQGQGASWRCLHTGLELTALLGGTASPAFSLDSNVCRTRLRWPESCVAELKTSSCSFVTIESAWVASHAPLQVVTASEGEGARAFQDRVEQVAKDTIEIVVLMMTDSVAALYAPSGLPLQRVDQAWFGAKQLCCRLKVLKNVSVEQLQQHKVEQEGAVYVPLSGSKHGDSSPFDTLPRPFSQHQHPSVTEITLFGSHQFVNGLQVRYSDSVCKTLGFGGPPASKQVLDLSGGDEVTKVSVRAGAIVDSVAITTRNGQVLRAGGQGGADAGVWELHEQDQDQASFAGFFGGTGGHLHNLGVVVREAPSPPLLPSPPPSSSSPVARLLERCEADPSLCKWEQLLGGNVQGVCSVLEELHAHEALTKAEKEQVLDAVIAYSNNIANDPSNEAKRRVKLLNAYFLKVAEGGSVCLALFCAGPAAFSLVPPTGAGGEGRDLGAGGEGRDLFLSSKLRLYHEGGTVGKSAVTEGMRSYALFLREFKSAGMLA